MQGFVASDLDGDGLLEATEVGPEMAADPEFTDNDADKNGGLTVDEVVAEKLADFKAIDTNGDGLLTLDELNAAYPAPKGIGATLPRRLSAGPEEAWGPPSHFRAACDRRSRPSLRPPRTRDPHRNSCAGDGSRL